MPGQGPHAGMRPRQPWQTRVRAGGQEGRVGPESALRRRVAAGMRKVRVRPAAGDLVRADVITGLRCRSGEAGAWWPGGWIRLAGPGCPPDFHARLAAEITDLDAGIGDRRAVLVRAEVTAGRAAWSHVTAMDLAQDAERSRPHR